MVTADDILGASVLVVDDQPANVLLLERMLHAAGYTSIMTTRDPREVQALHLRHRFDLILLDLYMPDMDGFQVMEDLKAVDQVGYLPVIVITAEPGQKVRALRAGARDFISKPLDAAEVLTRAYNMIQVRLLHRETHRLYEQLASQKRLSDRLLLNVLPEFIAARLKDAPETAVDSLTATIADSFSEATVLFADIVGFTELSASLNAHGLVAMLNEIFSAFDGICDARGLEKIKTIGDAYMAVAGLPIAVPDHAARAAHTALDMLDAVARYNSQRGRALQVRIGINTGAGVAGVIGKRKFIYDLWGDVVNTASRMESHGVAGRIQLSESTRQRLGPPFLLEPRGCIEIKGNGRVSTWFLAGRSPEVAPLPAEPVGLAPVVTI